MKKYILPAAIIVAALTLVACCGETVGTVFSEIARTLEAPDSGAEEVATVAAPQVVTEVAEDEPTPFSTATSEPASIPMVSPGECDAPAEPIDVNASHNLQMHSTTESYPANCLYYCFRIPDGENLNVGIYDFNVDLDLYLGFGDIEAVDGVQPVWGESYDWMSNEYGTEDEIVTIPDPQAGVYYAEVCSYEGEASPFELRVDFR